MQLCVLVILLCTSCLGFIPEYRGKAQQVSYEGNTRNDDDSIDDDDSLYKNVTNNIPVEVTRKLLAVLPKLYKGLMAATEDTNKTVARTRPNVKPRVRPSYVYRSGKQLRRYTSYW